MKRVLPIVLTLLFPAVVACSSDDNTSAPASGGSAGAAGVSGSAAGGSAGDGGAGGSSAVGGSAGTVGAGGVSGSGGAAPVQGSCEPPSAIASCTRLDEANTNLVRCVEIYSSDDLSGAQDLCTTSGGYWLPHRCVGNDSGWCEDTGAAYDSVIRLFAADAVAERATCEADGGTWCDGPATLRPECTRGGADQECQACLDAAVGPGGCCEAKVANCRADEACSGQLDCALACDDLACRRDCLTPNTLLNLDAFFCLTGSDEHDIGACGTTCVGTVPQ